MSKIFKKLNLKNQTPIMVMDAPQSFESEVAGLEGVEVVRRAVGIGEIEFAIAFVTSQDELDDAARVVAEKAPGDAVVWFAYPKKSSKRYTCEIDRDRGWEVLGRLGFEGVRQVAIDEDWSAVRFRRVQFIKTMKRDPKRALTEKGKRRTEN